MKYKLSILQTIFLLFSISLHSQNNTYVKPNIYAVIVGVSNYKDSNIPNLKYPEKDATDFYNFLRSDIAGAVQEDNLALLTGLNATRNNILKAVVDKFTRSNKEDLIIFYFSGHGKAGEFENMGYLLNYDTENDNEAGSALSMAEIKTKIDMCQAKMKISYIDACHAGLFKTAAKGSMEVDNGAIVSAYLEGISKASGGNISFLASSARQQSLENDSLGHGVFTYYLLKGLKGDADIEQQGAEGFDNGIVTTGELATYLTNKIQLATKYKQRPTIEGDPDGYFPLSVLRSGISITNEIARKSPDKIGIVKKQDVEKMDIKEKSIDVNPSTDPALSIKCYKCNGLGTISVQGICNTCNGTGNVSCTVCSGNGGDLCSSCHGSGIWPQSLSWGNGQKCDRCNGIGKASICKSCAGKGSVTCNVCNGGKIAITKEICPVCNGKGEIKKRQF